MRDKKLLVFYRLWRRRSLKRQQKRAWVCSINKKRQQFGEFHQLISQMRSDDPEKFFQYFRMDCQTFDDLLTMVKPALQKKHTRVDTISPEERLAVTLRYLATGDSQQTIAFSFRLGKTTVHKIVRETCKAIWDVLSPTYLKPPSTEDYMRISHDFETFWQFPHCIGAIDGKHVVIQAPKLAGSTYYNYKHTHSIVLIASCDAQYNFVHVDVGGAGRESDSGLFQTSTLSQQLQAGSAGLPTATPLPGTDIDMSYFLIGDEGFALQQFMMRPYPGRDLTVERRIFNYRLSRARRCIENTFGICAARWRIFRRPIIADVELVDNIVKSVCCLHNFLQMSQESSSRYCPKNFADREDWNGTVVPGEWRKVTVEGLRPLKTSSSKKSPKNALKQRDQLMLYLRTEGSVSWQDAIITRGFEH